MAYITGHAGLNVVVKGTECEIKQNFYVKRLFPFQLCDLKKVT